MGQRAEGAVIVISDGRPADGQRRGETTWRGQQTAWGVPPDRGNHCSPRTQAAHVAPPPPLPAQRRPCAVPLAGKRPKSALSFFRRSDGENEKKRRCACPISRFANGGCRRLCQSSSSSRLEKHSGSLFFPLILSLPLRV